jgi:hypothetical protein
MAGKKLMVHLQKIIICPRAGGATGAGMFTVEIRISEPLTRASPIQQAGKKYNVFDQVREKG